MKNLQRIVWSEGMFLMPQHFQAQDQVWEDITHQRALATAFEPWGIAELEIDRDALQQGTFRLLRCTGILRDGLLFSTPAPGDRPLSCVLDEELAPGVKEPTVFLTIPEHNPSGGNIRKGLDSDSRDGRPETRYLACQHWIEDDVDDVADPGNKEKHSIQVGRPNFRLWATKDGPPEQWTGLPLAKLQRRADGRFDLIADYSPPTLNVFASDGIMRLLRRRIDRLEEVSRDLGRRTVQTGRDRIGFGSAEDLWLATTVRSHLPMFTHIAERRGGHPEALYRELLRLAGELSVFCPSGESRDVPHYDHENLGACFGELDQKIEEWLSIHHKARYALVPLEESKRVWSGAIVDEGYFDGSQFFLGVRSPMGANDVIGLVSRSAKIASASEMEDIRRRAISGVSLQHVESPPGTIPRTPGTQYFRLNQGGRDWEAVRREKIICVFVPETLEEPQLELLVELS